MSILGIEMPNYTTRRDAFDVVFKPQVPFPDGYEIDWNNPERFTCDCCGFPMIINPGRYEMCSLCDWEVENYYPDENYGGGPNGNYMLFDARKNFEANGCMFIQEEGFNDFERNTRPEVLVAKRILIQACLDFLNIEKGSSEWFQAWETILRLEIDLINTQQGSQIDFEEVSNCLRRRAYPVAIGQSDGRYYRSIIPDFPGCSVEGCFTHDQAVSKTRTAMVWHIQSLKEKVQCIPEPTSIEKHKDKPEFTGWTWVLIEVNHHGL